MLAPFLLIMPIDAYGVYLENAAADGFMTEMEQCGTKICYHGAEAHYFV